MLSIPTHKQAFFTLLFFRLLAALFSPISDCDEVFNYWEPAHLILEGYGFETWEYRFSNYFVLSICTVYLI
jgi:alpha-1,2-mannosyltransferase